MKSFKSFLEELKGVAPKAGKEHEFVHSTYMAQVKDPGDLEKVGPEEEGPKTLKTGQGKRPADRLMNKQPFGEQKHPEDEKTDANKLQRFGTKKWLTKDYKNGEVKKEEVEQVSEEDFSKQQTKMAHTIGKHFKKKGVGDEYKGGPFAVAAAMVRDKPEAAAKAYKTIKAKTQKEDHQIALITLFDSLNEANQEKFLEKLEEDFNKLLQFSLELLEEHNG